MRCYCCNERLTEYEATRRNAMTGEFIDMCNTCYATIKDDLLTIEREDLLTNEAEETVKFGRDWLDSSGTTNNNLVDNLD